MLGGSTQPIPPLWFLAETERNIYLWRNGKSIADHGDFSFWVDIPALISKRRGQLARADSQNPFTNPAWGISHCSDRLTDDERDYLDSLDELVGTILKHAEALSVASETVRSELTLGLIPRCPVVLPSKAVVREPVQE